MINANIICNIVRSNKLIGGSSQLVLSPTTEVLPNAQYLASGRSPINQILFSPHIWWHESGNTYVSYRTPADTDLLARANMIQYSDKNGVGKRYVSGPRINSADEHPHPVIMTFGDEVYSYQEDPHASPLNIYKSRLPLDISSGFDYLSEHVLPSGPSYPAYPNIDPYPYDNPDHNAVIIGREGMSNAYRVLSASGGENWGSMLEITAVAGWDAGTSRMYTGVPFGNYRNGWYHYECVIRNDGENVWWDRFIFKTQDHSTFWNLEETYSKSVPGAFNQTDFRRFRYFSINYLTQGYKACSCVSKSSGNFYSACGDGAGGYVFISYKTNGTITTKAVSFPNMVTGAESVNPQDSPFVMMLVLDDAQIDLFVRQNYGTYNKIYRWRTEDEGDNWTLIEDMFPDVDSGIYYLGFPKNLFSLPPNKNSVIVGLQENPATDGPADLYIRRVAFGEIQAETPDTISAITSPSDISGEMFRYEVAAGKITNTGTTLTGLTDQSSNARAATIFGSPVINSSTTPTHIIFDGVNDRIELNTTGLLTLDKGTVWAIGRKRTTQTTTSNAGFLTWSNNASTVEYGVCSMSNSATYNKSINHLLSDSGGNILNMGGSTDYNDNNFHLFVWQFQSGKQTIFYVDGEYEDMIVIAGGERFYEGNFLNVHSFNRIVLGALVRTSNSFYDLDLQAVGMYNKILTWKEVKQLATYYGF